MKAINNGGDACPFEIVPYKGSADPSWRYVLINPYGAPPSIVMAPRGVKITDHLPELLMNYGGVIPVFPALRRSTEMLVLPAYGPAVNRQPTFAK